jgi:hypothetical protein
MPAALRRCRHLRLEFGHADALGRRRPRHFFPAFFFLPPPFFAVFFAAFFAFAFFAMLPS